MIQPASMCARCPRCGRRFGWAGKVVDRPPCPGCAHALHIRAQAHGRRVLCAWGTHGGLAGRGAAVARILDGNDLICLGTTAGGHPKHPLYLRVDAEPRPWAEAGGTT